MSCRWFVDKPGDELLYEQMSIYRVCREGLAVLLLSLVSPLEASTVKAQTASVELAARSCKEVSSCEEAVILWCDGYRRADGDNDGIPCENVCFTRRQVNEIRRSIGC
jgi:hypothetical protein